MAAVAQAASARGGSGCLRASELAAAQRPAREETAATPACRVRLGRRQLRRPARVASIRLLAFGEEEMDEGLRALWALNLLTWPAQPCFLIQPNFVD